MSKKGDFQVRKQLRERAAGLRGAAKEEGSYVVAATAVLSECVGVVDEALGAVRTSSSAGEKVFPLHLLGDLLDHTPLALCPAVVDYIESHEAALRRCLDVIP
eukprot:RCo032010